MMVFLSAVLSLPFLGAGQARAAVEKPPAPSSMSLVGEVYVAIYDKAACLTLETEAAYVIDQKMKLEPMVVPFCGVGSKPKKNVHSLNPAWFEGRADELMAFFAKHADEPERFFVSGPDKPYPMLFLAKAFEKELYDGWDKEKKWLDAESLRKSIVEGMVRDALLFAAKNQAQGRVKNPPRFSTLTRVMQPLMCTFMYGNPWLAIAECYRTSEHFTSGKEIYREYFLNVEVMTVLRRRFQVKASEKDLNGSVLGLPDDLFAEYHRECVRRWFDKQQYLVSKFEKMKMVKELPAIDGHVGRPTMDLP